MRKEIFIFVSHLFVSTYSIHPQCSNVAEKPKNCNQTQILCTKGYSSSTGCPLGYFCYDKSLDDPCDFLCPCLEDEITCHSGNPSVDPFTGCSPQKTCIPKETINFKGQICPNFCPAQCGPGFTACSPLIDKNGCYGSETCVSSLNLCPVPKYDANGCAIKNSKFCKRYCPGVFDENGCPGDVICAEEVDNKCPVSKYDSRGCSVVKPIQCEENEVRCSKGFDKRNCLIGFTCQDKFSENNCINYCPTICDEQHEKSCSQGIGFNGCPLPDICIPKIGTRYIYGQREINCTNHCRPSCDLTTHKLCPHVFDVDGCMGPETCIPRGNDCPTSEYDSNGCLVPKTKKCDEKTELFCLGGSDINGCKLQDTCMPRKVGNCLQTCPALCGQGMILCHSGVDENGCKLPDSCVPKQIPGFDQCNGICPKICNGEQVKCVVTKKPKLHLGPFFIQTKHCVLNEFCMDIVDKKTNCTNFCPTTCEDNEKVCEGPLNEQGCKLPDVCVPEMNRGGRGNLCPEHCPIRCPEGERPCPGNIKEDSCREPPKCVAKDKKCPQGERDFFGCKIIEKISKCEDNNSRICPGVYDNVGCRTAPECMQKNETCPQSTYDRNGCRVLGPVACKWSHQKFCPMPLDEKNCPIQGECIEIKNGKCNQYCEPICSSSEHKVCDGGRDTNSCPFPKFCYNKNKACPRKNPFIQTEYEPIIHRKIFDVSSPKVFFNRPFIY
ncbi:uncharacterized protein [Lepeophtheirus salmonis]|uniref:uncharacterized protein n=1 Tax=Lepeophtheirus salmonis TaxID=72036 RepID=UPI001AE264C4|nr:sortilin-related receptor-like [Lepeophtheirus salmonis]